MNTDVDLLWSLDSSLIYAVTQLDRLAYIGLLLVAHCGRPRQYVELFVLLIDAF